MSQREIVLQEEINDLVICASKAEPAAKELVISLDGSIDSYNAQDFETSLKKLTEAGHVNLIFACARLNYISSMGMGVFMNMLSSVKKKNGSILFVEVQEPVKKVFDHLGFSMFFTFKDTLETNS
jgi:anti-sigma B factor antagonist